MRLGGSSSDSLLRGSSPFLGCTYTSGKNGNADIHAAIEFQLRVPKFSSCWKNVCRAGVHEFIEVFGRNVRLGEAVQTAGHEFVKLFSF